MSSSNQQIPSKVLALGGSKNIGYFSACRLLDLGAQVTFLLRKPAVFDADERIQAAVKAGKARLVQGDALVRADVQRAWDEAARGGDAPVDLCVFTIGGYPKFSVTKGFYVSPANLVTLSMLNVLSTLPSPPPKLIALSSMGLTRAAHAQLALPLKPLYRLLLPRPHADKRGAEALVHHCAGRRWDDAEPGPDVLPAGWRDAPGLPARGTLRDVVVVRPALLTDGECRAERGTMYRTGEDGVPGTYTISRRDVAHFVVEGVVKNWSEWRGKSVTIGY